ncbi:cytochrome b5-like heme/steroid binding domain-containing protein [Ilyonectria robusta]|uniref:cytochrome b5-like heme/steroid binding domain-containing protein n=1 Tax=Ilyonectria robusta TaxID=1079257 RepID=UPI001E8EDAE4|nr:cytochrome b5-like heme/steroid binding domain-containing protein [Ilyonectria robusta]KAH8673219.1 cytochrome b5-like heme/steroid binding domain-containing protein [Ilyonectria robusta]
MAAPRSFTLQEVAEHDGEYDPYMVIRNKVYDCTSFLKKHPGGKEVLLEVAGTDATEAYEEVGHSEEADEKLERLYIGELIAAPASVS